MLSWIEWMIFGNHFKPQETELHSVFLRHFYVSPYWTDWPFMFPASLPVLPHGQLLTRPCASNWYVNRTSFDIFLWYWCRRFMAFTACQCPSPCRGNVLFLPISSVIFSLWCSVLFFSLISRSPVFLLLVLLLIDASVSHSLHCLRLPPRRLLTTILRLGMYSLWAALPTFHDIKSPELWYC